MTRVISHKSWAVRKSGGSDTMALLSFCLLLQWPLTGWLWHLVLMQCWRALSWGGQATCLHLVTMVMVPPATNPAICIANHPWKQGQWDLVFRSEGFNTQKQQLESSKGAKHQHALLQSWKGDQAKRTSQGLLVSIGLQCLGCTWVSLLTV